MEEQVKDIDTRKERIKKHFRDNRKTYITGIAAFTAGVVVGVITFTRKPITIQEHVNALIAQNMTARKITNNTVQTISMYGNVIGRPGNVVYDTTDRKLYKAQCLGAAAVGATSDMMSKHLSGKLPHLNGHVFERVSEV